MIAVIRTGGKQYKVSEKQVLRVEKLSAETRKENQVVFKDVLLVADKTGKLALGSPTVKNAHVEAQVVSDGKSKKVRVVKYKPKTRYKRVIGHRQPYTEVRIEKIIG